MTVNRIKEVAFYYFSKYGYEGTSLSMIAKKVGFKTPSLYAHFESKEHIFFSCLADALESDMRFFQDHLQISENRTAENILYTFLINYEKRLLNEDISMFCLRTLYSPPHTFKLELFHQTNERIADLGLLLRPLFEWEEKKGNLREIKIEEAIEAFLCLFDGLVIEFMYAGSERFQSRLEASWRVFTQGLFKEPARI